MGKLFFIGGFPSGGTDLIKTVINAHPAVDIRGEIPFLFSLKKEGFNEKMAFDKIDQLEELKQNLKKLDVYNRIGNLSYDFSADLKQNHSITLQDALWSLLSPSDSIIRGSKTPQFTEQLPCLFQLFPSASFLIIVRDVRDVCVSWNKKWGKNMILCASKWATRLSGAWQFTQKDPLRRTFFLRYEDLLNNPREVCQNICNFLTIPFSENMLEHHKYTPEKIDGKINYGERLVINNQGNWKSHLSSDYIKRIEEVAFDVMQLFGYEPSLGKQQKKITQYEFLNGRFHDLYGLLFIGNRMMTQKNRRRMWFKNIYIEIKKRCGSSAGTQSEK